MLNKTAYDVEITFIEPVLGSQPQKDVVTEHIAKKVKNAMAENAPNGEIPADELETLPEQLERATTVFHKHEGQPVLWNYQIRGFLKEVGQNFNGHMNVKNLRSKINNNVFVSPRMIPLESPDAAEPQFMERPLRAMTAQGPRIAVARSETLPAGTVIRFRLSVFKDEIKEALLRDLLSYGENQGLGQWRNASWGSFTYTMTRVEE